MSDKFTTPEQRMMLCPHCLSEDGHYAELDQKLHEKFGIHYTRGKSWRGGPRDTDWKGERVRLKSGTNQTEL